MIFPVFPGVLSFFQVFQVEWEPCRLKMVPGVSWGQIRAIVSLQHNGHLYQIRICFKWNEMLTDLFIDMQF